ncbi:hypothetical protein NKI79_18830 [Mesorhizobium sp. M0340]
MMRWAAVCAMMGLAIFSSSAIAAEVELLDLPGDLEIISIKGEITDGATDRFHELVEKKERISVVLQSPGGLIKEALQIGAEIPLRNSRQRFSPTANATPPAA